MMSHHEKINFHQITEICKFSFFCIYRIFFIQFLSLVCEDSLDLDLQIPSWQSGQPVAHPPIEKSNSTLLTLDISFLNIHFATTLIYILKIFFTEEIYLEKIVIKSGKLKDKYIDGYVNG